MATIASHESTKTRKRDRLTKRDRFYREVDVAKVAFLGTGLLGSAMVEGLLRRGNTVTVWNRTESKARALEQSGATVAATPEDAIGGAQHVHMTLPDDAVVDEM